MVFSSNDQEMMRLALTEASKSAADGEVPVGAVLTGASGILAAAGNRPISSNDPTAHAEILTLRAAAEAAGNYRLVGTTLYVTLEPCLMCMGAIVHARVSRLVFGAFDPKSGAAVSVYQICSDGLLNHSVHIEGGLLEEPCRDILRLFFRQRRGR